MGNTPGELLKSETIQPHHFGTGIVRKGETLRIVDVVLIVEPPTPLHGPSSKDERAARRGPCVQHKRVRDGTRIENGTIVLQHLYVVDNRLA